MGFCWWWWCRWWWCCCFNCYLLFTCCCVVVKHCCVFRCRLRGLPNSNAKLLNVEKRTPNNWCFQANIFSKSKPEDQCVLFVTFEFAHGIINSNLLVLLCRTFELAHFVVACVCIFYLIFVFLPLVILHSFFLHSFSLSCNNFSMVFTFCFIVHRFISQLLFLFLYLP